MSRGAIVEHIIAARGEPGHVDLPDGTAPVSANIDLDYRGISADTITVMELHIGIDKFHAEGERRIELANVLSVGIELDIAAAKSLSEALVAFAARAEEERTAGFVVLVSGLDSLWPDVHGPFTNQKDAFDWVDANIKDKLVALVAPIYKGA